MTRVTVIGAGYVGLVAAACLAELGHDVISVERDADRLSALTRGEAPFHEPGLPEMVRRQRRAGRLCFSDDYGPAVRSSSTAFIAVNTPSASGGEADTSFVLQAAQSILAHARPGLVIVIKSTVPPGTGDAVAELAAAAGVDVDVVSNPEFLREGSAVKDFLKPDRIVLGAGRPEAGEAAASLLAGIDAPVIICGRRSAEMGKYAANALLASRISFMNEIAAICEVAGADIDDVVRIVGTDHRIGPYFLNAGLGWGGSCFPKDVRALAKTATTSGYRPAILDATLDVNAGQRHRAFARLHAALGDCAGATVAVLGLAFKPHTDDVREAPALDLIERLHAAGARVQAHDPVAVTTARRVAPSVTFCDDPYDAAVGSDALVLATEWPEYRSLDWRLLRELMRGRVVLDGRNILDAPFLSSLGFTYLGFGRPTGKNGRSAAPVPQPPATSVLSQTWS